LVGKQVTFSTNLGSLTGPNPVTTNAQGQATIQISSTVQGTATVTAAVVADGVEASCAVAFETWVIAQMEQVGPEIRPVKQPPWPAWPANVMFSEVAYAPLVAGAHTYELEVYNKDPQQGGQRVGQPIHLSSQGAYPDPDNPTRFYYVVYQTSDWVADAGSAATVIAALHEQYDTYWVRVRVLN
jgi:hypothetical protein